MSRQTVLRAFRSLTERAKGFGLLPKPVRLSWGRPEEFPAPRNHAMTDGRIVWVAPRMESAPRERVLGVLAHEVGHAILLQAGLADHRETDADVVGAKLLGRPIGYDRLDVQCAGLRRPRPNHLPNPQKKTKARG